jgi:hypothetical protein
MVQVTTVGNQRSETGTTTETKNLWGGNITSVPCLRCFRGIGIGIGLRRGWQPRRIRNRAQIGSGLVFSKNTGGAPKSVREARNLLRNAPPLNRIRDLNLVPMPI